jgi:hypothetical protein
MCFGFAEAQQCRARALVTVASQRETRGLLSARLDVAPDAALLLLCYRIDGHSTRSMAAT